MATNSAIKLHEINEIIAELISLLAYVSYEVLRERDDCSGCRKATMSVYRLVGTHIGDAKSHHEAVARLTRAIYELADLVDLGIVRA